jgi:DNA repair protein RecN (Recombination protein N)
MDRAAEAAAALSKVSEIDPRLDALAQRATDISAVLDDLGGELRSYRDSVEHDPSALDEVLRRLGELSGLARKYGPRLDDVLKRRDEARRALADSEEGAEAAELAEARVTVARSELERAAEVLTAVRVKAAPDFIEALTESVRDLAMEGARFEVSFAELSFEHWTADGAERVEFLYAPAPDQPARPLAKIASGGEISRVMLALKGVLGDADSVETLVFDEVDAGIGGATARTIGARLAQVARTHQVIVVTHLAQVAAFADAHLVVSKSVDATTAATTVMPVTGEDRVAEVARMLSGNGSRASSAHARELLEDATTAR